MNDYVETLTHTPYPGPAFEPTDNEVYKTVRQGLSLSDFLSGWKVEVDAPMTGLDPTDRRYRHYTRYNWDRYMTTMAQVELSDEASRLMKALAGPQTWMFLTETWCADAAFSLPVIQSMANAAKSVTLRVLSRDQNPRVMDRFLTGSARAIPILAVFDADGNQILRWGSKPDALAAMVKDLKGTAASAADITKATLNWYQESGWREVQDDLVRAFKRAV